MKIDAVLIGYSSLAEELVASQTGGKHAVLNFKGIVADVGSEFVDVKCSGGVLAKIPVLGSISNLCDNLEKTFAGAKPVLILAVDEERDDAFLQNISRCINYGYEMYEILDVYEMLMRKVPVMHIQEHWLLRAFDRPKLGYRVFKGVVDTIIALASGILALPIFFIAACMIKLTSKGPVFYKQVRVGKGGREFVIYKFRTMRENAEEDDAVWAVKNDSRVTWFGRLLRKARLDELPQLFNVLKGEMSIIGPRPERPEFVSQLIREIPFYNYRHTVKPGITGWAQVKFCYACSVESSMQKLQYDLYGIRNAGISYDLEVLLRTMWVMFTGAGAH